VNSLVKQIEEYLELPVTVTSHGPTAADRKEHALRTV
jgi:hypothetical protein